MQGAKRKRRRKRGDKITTPTDYLSEWMERFVKNKDLILRKIEHLSRKEDRIIAKLKDGKEHTYIVEPFLDDNLLNSALDRLKGCDVCSIVAYNTRENLDVMMRNWETLSKFSRHLSIHFVNPFSRTEKRWTIYPMTHDMITEKAGLKPGLMSLFSNVDAVTREEIEKVVKSSN